MLARTNKLTTKQVRNWLERKRCTTKKKGITTESKGLSLRAKRKILLHHFKQFQYPNLDQISHLIELTGMSEKKVLAWFSKQRFKCKKNKK